MFDGRLTGPVFTENDGTPLGKAVMKRVLHHMVKTFIPAAMTHLYTWHSFRIHLACALLAKGVKRATIQAMLRWATEESLLAYARMPMQECARLLDMAASACIASVQTSSLPMTEQYELFLSMHEMAEQL